MFQFERILFKSGYKIKKMVNVNESIGIFSLTETLVFQSGTILLN